jgi:hypothetical protein
MGVITYVLPPGPGGQRAPGQEPGQERGAEALQRQEESKKGEEGGGLSQAPTRGREGAAS